MDIQVFKNKILLLNKPLWLFYALQDTTEKQTKYFSSIISDICKKYEIFNLNNSCFFYVLG